MSDFLFEEEPSGPPSMPSRIEREFFVHSAKHGGKLLAMMAEAMNEREHSQPCGSDTLPRHLRFAHPDSFGMHNNFAPWYMAALAIVRPDLARLVICDVSKVARLKELNWPPPSLEGGTRRD